MAIFVRFISRAKWPTESEMKSINVDEIDADAITCCLKTVTNTLSIWVVDNEEMLENAALAFISKAKKIDTLQMIWINSHTLTSSGLKTRITEGFTAVDDMKERHINIYELKLFSLRIFASIVLDSLINNHYRKFSKHELYTILKQGIDNKRLMIEDISEDLKNDYSKATERYG